MEHYAAVEALVRVVEIETLKRRWRYKQEQTRGQRAPGAAERERERGGGARLVCVRCGHPITTGAERIEKNGLHQHSQVNPHGFVWHFGCFAAAPGCIPTSAPSTEFTWFVGYAWQIENCRSCLLHLGWRFSSDQDSFHGLVLDRLVERGQSDPDR